MAEDDTNEGIPAPEGAANVIETDYKVGQHKLKPKLVCSGLISIIRCFWSRVWRLLLLCLSLPAPVAF